jgi:hypothetical protein
MFNGQKFSSDKSGAVTITILILAIMTQHRDFPLNDTQHKWAEK